VIANAAPNINYDLKKYKHFFKFLFFGAQSLLKHVLKTNFSCFNGCKISEPQQNQWKKQIQSVERMAMFASLSCDTVDQRCYLVSLILLE
jgi:hypothetical protein